MEDATANAAPFDARYLYLSGGFQDQAEPCASCATGCSTTNNDGIVQDCSNAAGGCGWWGCWQWDQDPPGKYVVDFVSRAAAAQYGGQARPQIPMITYYESLHASGVNEGTAQIRALEDQAFLARYFADFRLVLQKVGTATALLHLEPDLWGYASQLGNDPHEMPAPITSANSVDCPSHENSAAGFARCLIAMTRKYAPNAKVGLHASAWGTNIDVFLNRDLTFDVAAEATKLGKFLVDLGAAEGDFIVADMSDRDAGFYEKQGRDVWWDPSNQSLPNFHQAFAWGKALSTTVGKPIVWWQIPLGNTDQNDTTNHYRDNRVDYLLSHLDEVVAGNGAALLFGAGESQQTLPETDGGNLIAKVTAAASRPRTACP